MVKLIFFLNNNNLFIIIQTSKTQNDYKYSTGVEFNCMADKQGIQ